MDWSFESLLGKAKTFAQRAHEFPRDDPQFPLWCAFSLEMLGRAVLAKIHPSLLADPSDGENILGVFGLSPDTTPKSIPVKTVFQRCTRICKEFTLKDAETAMIMMDRRNSELHSGTAEFEELDTAVWLHDYYRIAKCLLGYLKLNLTDLLGNDDGTSAEKMVTVELKKVEEAVRAAVRMAKDDFYRLEKKEQEAAWELAKRDRPVSGTTRVKCPACGGQAVLTSLVVSYGNARLTEDGIVRSVAYLPTQIKCSACKLSLNGHEKMHIIGHGGQFSVQRDEDPVEWFGLRPMAEEEPYNDE